jgi:hypothetical protein
LPTPAFGATPQQRWRAAIAVRPLEASRPLPTAFHAMATAITGRPHPPRFTTGPATRHALAATGALGATTGSVVHLATVPVRQPAAVAVLAHELMHTRYPVSRPRFLLAGTSAPVDDDERAALATGRGLLGGGSGGPGGSGAGIVDRLPVGAGIGAVGELATRAARAAVLEATAAASLLAADRPGSVTAPAATVPTAPDATVTEGAGSTGGVAVGGPNTGLGGGPGTGQPPGQTHGVAAGPGGGTALDADRVVELVEERLLREIERRGGRWAGVF